MASTLPWVEKYRPRRVADVVSQEAVTTTLRQLIAKHDLPHLLFYGPAGTGKTSTILALAAEIFGDAASSHVLELNASDDRGIDVVRESVKTFASSAQLFGDEKQNLKLVILDEADAMTSAAQFALRRVIEKYTRTTRFCFICNNEQKIIPAIQSRCTRFRFKPLKQEQVVALLARVADQEGLDLADGEAGLRAVAMLSEGDMRCALNLLQAVGRTVTADAAHRAAGAPTPTALEGLYDALLRDPAADVVRRIDAILAEGVAPVDIITDLSRRVVSAPLGAAYKAHILSTLAEAEDNILSGCGVALQMRAVVGVFVLAR